MKSHSGRRRFYVCTQWSMLVFVHGPDDNTTSYDRIEDLPQWMQEKMTLLRMLPIRESAVEGLGTRVSHTSFLIDEPTGEDDDQ